VVADGPSYDCAGYYGNTCGVPDPKFKGKLRIGYDTPLPGWRLSSDPPRRLGDQRQQSPNQLLNGAILTGWARLPQFNYLDLTASYAVNKTVSVLVGATTCWIRIRHPDERLLPDCVRERQHLCRHVRHAGRFIFANVTTQLLRFTRRVPAAGLRARFFCGPFLRI